MTLSFSAISVFVVLSCLLIAIFQTNNTTKEVSKNLELNAKKLQEVNKQTEEILQNNLKIIGSKADENFSLFFEKTESLLNSMEKSEEMNILINHNSFERGDVMNTRYKNLTKWNKDAVNREINPFLENIVESYEEVQLGYVVTPSKAVYMGPAPDVNLYNFDATQREWYIEALKKDGKIYWSEAYVDKVTNKPVTTITKVIKRNKKVVGVVGLDISLEKLSTMIKEMELGKNGDSILVDQKGFILVHSGDTSLVGKNINEKSKELEPVMKEKENFFGFNKDGIKYVVYFITNEKTGWKIVNVVEEKELFATKYVINQMEIENTMAIAFANEQKNIMMFLLLLIGVIGLLVSIVGSFLLTNTVSKKVKGLQDAMEKVAQGDLSQELEYKVGDEIDGLSNQFKNTTGQLRNILFKNKKLSHEIEQSTTNLAAFTEEVSAQTYEVSNHVKEITNITTNQAAETQKTSEIVEQFSDIFKKVNENTENVKHAVEQALQREKEGSESVEKLKETSEQNLHISEEVSDNIKKLTNQISEIESFTETIKTISEQTNLLSLNASIEAARAGEQGKGFMVVATEIKILAEQAKKAASEIELVINKVQKQSNISVDNIYKTEQIAKTQHEMVHKTKDAFSNIQESIKEVILKMDEVTTMMTHVNIGKKDLETSIETIQKLSEKNVTNYEKVSFSVEEQAKAIDEVNKATQKLAEMTDSLNREVNRFEM